jgi:hypothetical protein
MEIAATLPITAPATSGVAFGVPLVPSDDFVCEELEFVEGLVPGPPMNPGTKVGSPRFADLEEELSI